MSNVCVDLVNSPFYYKLNGITYYFSTKGHLAKFENNYIKSRLEMRERLLKRYRLDMSCELASDLYLYIMVENRGFLIKTVEGVLVRWPDQIKLNGETLIVNEWKI